VSDILPYIVAAVVCLIVYPFAQIPFGLLVPFARKGPGRAQYCGTLIGFGAALLSVYALLLIPMIFPKVSLIVPATVRFMSDLNRWHRTYSTLEATSPSEHGNYEGLERVTKLEQGSVWGGLLGYFFGAMSALEANPIL
jgi:hypothetical protein